MLQAALQRGFSAQPVLSVAIRTPISHPRAGIGRGWVLFVYPAVCISSCLYILLFVYPHPEDFSCSGFVAGLRLGLSFEGHLGRASLNQGCAGGRKSSARRGLSSHGLCAERRGLFSPSRVTLESRGEEEKGICTSRSSHQRNAWEKASTAPRPGCHWLFTFSNMPKDILKQFLLHK